MPDEMRYIAVAIYAGRVGGGAADMIAALRELGATRLGRHVARAPIEAAVACAEMFDYAPGAHAASDLGWTAKVGLAPYASITIAWPERAGGSWRGIRSVYDRLLGLGDVELAACDRVPDHEDERSAPRPWFLGYLDGARYAELGPVTLGASTLLGPRLVGLLEPDLRDALQAAGHRDDRGLAMGDPGELRSRFDASRVVQRIRIDPAGIARTSAGPGWVPLAAGPAPRALDRKAAGAIKKLQHSTASQAAPAEGLKLARIVAPFSVLDRIRAIDVDFATAKLGFSKLEGATLRDIGAVATDLRAIEASGSDWLESSLDSADLRWADLSRTRFGASTLDGANLSHAVLSDSEILESAVDACFDNVTALRWKPDAPDFPATMTGATFRNAVLHEARSWARSSSARCSMAQT